MTGLELRDLRQHAKLSQAQLASAIGMTRESIGRIERGRMAIEKRTELAVRYIAERRRQDERSTSTLQSEVAHLLDHIHSGNSHKAAGALRATLEAWASRGGSQAGQVIARTHEITDRIESAEPDATTDAELARLRIEWAALTA